MSTKAKKHPVKKDNKPIEALRVEAEPVNDAHGAMIDAYFINGFNTAKAMLSVNPDLNWHTAEVMGNAILNNERNKAYIQQKRSALRASTDIRNENVLRELMNWAYCDARQFMCLSEEEIKELPDDLGRCIQGFKSFTKDFFDKEGNKVSTTKTLEIKFVDKKSAMDSIAKHIGFYLIDNEQKRTKINLTKVDATILNGFLEAIEYQDADS